MAKPTTTTANTTNYVLTTRKKTAATLHTASFRVNVGNIELRNETLDGRDYLVAPVIAVREQVLNGLLTLQEDIVEFLYTWNDIPVPVHHPEDENGFPLPAKDPEILRNQVIGRFFNAHWVDSPSGKGGALHGEIWFDVQKCEELGGEALQVLTAVRNGEVIEVSTGYYAYFDDSEGEYNGVPYVGIARDIRPEHLAVLPGEIGACSVRDGCGVPRINKAKGNDMPDDTTDITVNAAHEGIMVALYVPTPINQLVSLANAANLPEGSTAVPANELHLTLGYFGKADDAKFTQNELFAAVSDYAKYAPLVRGQFGGIGRFKKVEDNDTNPLYLSFDSPQFPCWRQRLVQDLEWKGIRPSNEHGYTPHITLAYLPVDAPTPAIDVPDTELAFTFIAVAWKGQVTIFPLQGLPRPDDGDHDAPVETAVTTFTQEQVMPQTNEEVEEEVVDEVELEEETPTAESPDGEEEVIAVENEADDAGAEMVEEPAAPDIDQLVADRVAAAIAPYQEVLGSLQANASRERGTLIAEILGADNCALTRNQLEKADTALLTNLAQTLRKPDYSGQGHFIPNTAVTNDLEPIEAPKLFDNE